jgi:hypothetical protein
MKFNVVLGNPPYNSDMYLSFVKLGHNLATDYDAWITPAKFQCADNNRNIDFRKNYVPSICTFTYYPDCSDIFGIRLNKGIAYYLADKNTHTSISITNKCSYQELYNDISVRELIGNTCLYNKGQDFIKKLGHFDSLDIESYKDTQTGYKVRVNNRFNTGGGRINMGSKIENPQYTQGVTFSATGNLLVLQPVHISDEPTTSIDTCIFSSEDESVCNSFISYVESKFCRYLIFLAMPNNLCSNYSFRFVPNQEFDKVFEDNPIEGYQPNSDGEYIDNNGNKHCSLYAKYKLTENEINIIESVIRERK